jgi:MarR family.
MRPFDATKIDWDILKELSISLNEYIILDFIWKSVNLDYYSLTKNNDPTKWSTISRMKLAKESGLCKVTILNIIKRLERKGFVERDENSFLRTTEKFKP